MFQSGHGYPHGRQGLEEVSVKGTAEDGTAEEGSVEEKWRSPERRRKSTIGGEGQRETARRPTDSTITPATNAKGDGN